MKSIRSITLLIAAVTVVACNAVHKNTTTSAAATSGTTAITTPPSDSYLFIKPLSGTRPPAEPELAAIQMKYKDVTMAQLNAGHEIYTTGACIGCHNAVDINTIEVTQWPAIMDDMALRANLTDTEKNAVNKYVLSLKATQAAK